MSSTVPPPTVVGNLQRTDTRKVGYLHKFSNSMGALGLGFLRNWKRRYFVLNDGVNIDYYVDESLKKGKGTYRLNADCTVKIVYESGPTEFTFVLEDSKRKITHLMAAESEEDRARWMAVICEAICNLEAFCNNKLDADSDSTEPSVEASAEASVEEKAVPKPAVDAEPCADEDDEDSDDEDFDSDNESGGEDGGEIVKEKLRKGATAGGGAAAGASAGKFAISGGQLGFNSAGILIGGSWTRPPSTQRAGGNGGGGGDGDTNAPKYASDTIAVLNAQLVADGKKPLEFLPLKSIKNELARIFEKVNAGEEYDEGRMDHLLKCMEFNPEYRREKEAEAQRWRSTTVEYSKECLEVMRGFVPTNVFTSSLVGLQEQGLCKDLAKRIYTKKCLWLVRMRTEDLMKLHEADLLGKFGCEALQLDIVELCAIYAIAPTKFTVDASGKKEIWRSSLEGQVRKMLAEKDADKLPKNKLRAISYRNQPAVFTEDKGWKVDNRVTGDAFGKQDDFRKVCQEAADMAVDDLSGDNSAASSIPANSSSAGTRPLSVPHLSVGSGTVELAAPEPARRPMSMQRPNPGGGEGLTLMQQLAMRKKIGADPEEANPRVGAPVPAPGRLSTDSCNGGAPGGMTLMQQIAMRNKGKSETTEIQEVAPAASPATSLFASVESTEVKPVATPAARPQLSFMDQIKKRQQLE